MNKIDETINHFDKWLQDYERKMKNNPSPEASSAYTTSTQPSVSADQGDENEIC